MLILAVSDIHGAVERAAQVQKFEQYAFDALVVAYDIAGVEGRDASMTTTIRATGPFEPLVSS